MSCTQNSSHYQSKVREIDKFHLTWLIEQVRKTFINWDAIDCKKKNADEKGVQS